MNCETPVKSHGCPEGCHAFAVDCDRHDYDYRRGYAGGILFALWFLGSLADFAPGPLGELLAYVSLSAHFPDFMRGVVDTRAVVYYVTMTAIFLFMAIRSTETDRWQ